MSPNICARGCSAYLFAVGKVAAADRSGVPRCAEAKKVRAEKLDAWLMARTMTWLRSTLPLLDADAKRRVDAALAKHGK